MAPQIRRGMQGCGPRVPQLWQTWTFLNWICCLYFETLPLGRVARFGSQLCQCGKPVSSWGTTGMETWRFDYGKLVHSKYVKKTILLFIFKKNKHTNLCIAFIDWCKTLELGTILWVSKIKNQKVLYSAWNCLAILVFGKSFVIDQAIMGPCLIKACWAFKWPGTDSLATITRTSTINQSYAPWNPSNSF